MFKILTLSLLLLSSSAHAKPRIVYIDDIGEISGGLDWASAADYNGIQDLIMVMVLSRHYRLEAIGVGISGKRVSNNSARAVDVEFAKKLAGRHRPNTPVLSGHALRQKIRALAATATPEAPLFIAVGGPWYDVSMLLNTTEGADAIYPSIKNNIRVIGTGGSNITNTIHRVGGAKEAYDNVRAKLGSRVTVIRGAYYLSTAYTLDVNYMNNFYQTHMVPLLAELRDSEGELLTGPKYRSAVDNLNRGSFLEGHRLRFGDVATVLTAVGVRDKWGCDPNFTAEDQLCTMGIFKNAFLNQKKSKKFSVLPIALRIILSD